MANMGYCRFQNTLQDLRDCYDHIWDDDLSYSEERARLRLIKLCHDLASDTEYEYEEMMEARQAARKAGEG